MDSLDTVERVMFVEELLGEVPNEHAGSQREIVDWLQAHLTNTQPNGQARALLKELARNLQWPELAEGLDQPWRREQIAAIIREIFRER